MLGGADCGLVRKGSSSRAGIWNLPNKLLSILKLILFCREDFVDLGRGASDGAGGSYADGCSGRGKFGR